MLLLGVHHPADLRCILMSLHGGGAQLRLSESFQNTLEVVGWIVVAAVFVTVHVWCGAAHVVEVMGNITHSY
jgi:hypothetical protein